MNIMEDMQILQCYKNLACEIVRQAIKDYKILFVKKLKSKKRNIETESVLKGIRSFFHSEWFSLLSDVDPDKLVNSIERQCYKKMGFKTLLEIKDL